MEESLDSEWSKFMARMNRQQNCEDCDDEDDGDEADTDINNRERDIRSNCIDDGIQSATKSSEGPASASASASASVPPSGKQKRSCISKKQQRKS